MAEQVQAVLDTMVAPLKDLIDRHIFTPDEVQAIVKRRRESEYLLRRRVARKADFLRYIEAEEMLEELRKLRLHQRQRDHRQSVRTHNPDDDEEEGKQGDKKEETHIGDVHIMQLIHLLFTRAIRKFRSDLSLHLLHVDFCKKHKSWTKLSKVYAEALQIFPRKEGLWIEAASHEFFGERRSIRNARILLQRGIRRLEKSQDLWIEYFSLELHYAQTLRGRRQILIKGGGRFEEQHVQDEGDMTAAEYYKIASVIYKNAIRAIPDSVEFRLRFLDTCRKFPDTESLMETMQEQIQRDFSAKPEAWVARAVFEAEKAANKSETMMDKAAVGANGDHDIQTEGNDKSKGSARKRARTKDTVITVLEEGLEAIDTYEMKLHIFRFAMRYAFEKEEEGDNNAVKQAQELASSIIESCDCQTELVDLAFEQVEYYISQDHVDQALTVLETFCTASGNDASATMWIRWAGLYPDQDAKAKSIFKRALGKISLSKPDHMSILLQYFGCLLKEDEPNKVALNDTFQRILLLAPTAWDIAIPDVSQYWFGIRCVAQAYLKYLILAVEQHPSLFGQKAVRKIYESVLFRSTVRLDDTESPNYRCVKVFVDTAVQVETSDRRQRQRILDKAIEIFEGTLLAKQYRQKRNDGVFDAF